MNQDEIFMNEALKLAKKCVKSEDVPVGAIIVKNNKIIGKGYNKRNKTNNALMHAEMIAISNACKKVHDWVLEDAVMYVTLEPCIMCSGAIIQSRIKKIVYGASSDKNGCCGSIMNIMDNEKMMHKVEVESNVLKDECSNIIKDFFENLRNKNSNKK